MSPKGMAQKGHMDLWVLRLLCPPFNPHTTPPLSAGWVAGKGALRGVFPGSVKSEGTQGDAVRGGAGVFLHMANRLPLLLVPLSHHDAHLPFWRTWVVPAAPISQVQMVSHPFLPPLSPLPSPQSRSARA